jgi:hypothetical protein
MEISVQILIFPFICEIIQKAICAIQDIDLKEVCYLFLYNFH